MDIRVFIGNVLDYW